jgi:hypothetical protein
VTATRSGDLGKWVLTPASGRGRKHGTSTAAPFDRWFRYPAGFASDYVGLLLDQLDLTSGSVIDCFAGSGVTGTAARARGLDFVGIEAHPQVAELARLKVAPTADPASVRSLAREALERAKAMYADSDIDGETDLVKRSFSGDTLCKLIALRAFILDQGSSGPAVYLKWALLGTLRDVAEVKVGWPYQRPGVERKPRHSDAFSRFEQRVQMIADDLAGLTGGRVRAEIILGDSRLPETWDEISVPRSAACIASPPYLNNFDYADATRLELFFWGTARTWGEMCSTVRSDMLTATTQQSSVGAKREALEQLRKLPGTARIEPLVERISDYRRQRDGRTKEYDQMVPEYFLGIHQVLANLVKHLEPGGTALWLVGDSAPYGVFIDTPALIGECAEGVGFTVADDALLRVRGDRWGSNSDRHKVPLSERLLVLKAPA